MHWTDNASRKLQLSSLCKGRNRSLVELHGKVLSRAECPASYTVMKGIRVMRRIVSLMFFTALSCGIIAQSASHRLIFDATAPGFAPKPVPTQLGTNRTPDGSMMTVNNQYLMRNGKPWLPVMGEFHYSRYPEANWEEEILKMKASGVDIIATYVIWIHHEEI